MTNEPNSETVENFRLWAENQPGSLTYSEAKRFLADLLDTSNAEAELELARMQEADELKIVGLHKSSGKRVFLRPLETLSIDHIRSVWDGTSHSTQSTDTICSQVHDRTGHDKEDVRAYLDQLHRDDYAEVNDERFRWKEQDDVPEDY